MAFKLIVSLIVLSHCSDVCTTNSTQYISRYELHHMMEDALLSNNQTIYDIQKKLLSYSGYTVNYQYRFLYFFDTCLIVDKLECPLNQSSIGFLSGSYHKCWNFQWTDSVLMDLISEDIISLLDPISGSIRASFISLTKSHSIYDLHIHLTKLPCIKEHFLVDEFITLLTWVSCCMHNCKHIRDCRLHSFYHCCFV